MAGGAVFYTERPRVSFFDALFSKKKPEVFDERAGFQSWATLRR